MNKKFLKTRVSKIMLTDIKPLSPDYPVESLVKYFVKKHITSLSVVDAKGVFLGEVRRIDFLKTCVDLHDISITAISEYGSKIDRSYSAQTARDLMVTKDRILRGNETVQDALLIMLKEEDDAIPVLDARDHLKGIVTDDVLLKHMYGK